MCERESLCMSGGGENVCKSVRKRMCESVYVRGNVCERVCV